MKTLDIRKEPDDVVESIKFDDTLDRITFNECDLYFQDFIFRILTVMKLVYAHGITSTTS